MELADIAQQIERLNHNMKAQLGQLAGDISQLKQDIARQASSQQSSGGAFGIGQSLERAGYNMSISVTAFGEKIKLAFIWGAAILGTSVATVLILMWLILKDYV